MVAADAVLVAHGGLGDDVGRLGAVEKIHQRLGDARALVEVVDMAHQVALSSKARRRRALEREMPT